MAQLLDAYMGLVYIRRQLSFGGNEIIDDHEQLPQFLPRLDWPQNHITRLPRKDALPAKVNRNNPQELMNYNQKFQTTYGAVTPMPPYAPDYDGVLWSDHVGQVHNLLTRTLREEAQRPQLDAEGMNTLLRIVSYGMFQSMTYLRPWTTGGPNVFSKAFDVPLNRAMTDGIYREPGRLNPWYQQRFANRRWIAVPISFDNKLWGMTVFDREQGHLYIFDCGHRNGRPKRIKASVHLWIQFWQSLGIGSSFQYFVPPVTGLTTPNMVHSGLAAVHWLMLALRNQVGPRMIPGDPNVIVKDYLIGYQEPAYQLMASELCLIDWSPANCGQPKTGVNRIKLIFKAMLCNELGICGGINTLLDRRPLPLAQGQGQHPGPPWTNISLAILHAGMPPVGCMPSNLYWRATGGLQIAFADMTPDDPYVHLASRRHHRMNMNNVPIEFRHPQLVHRRGVLGVWPANAHTVVDPVRLPAPTSRLRGRRLQPRDELDSLTRRNFRVYIDNPRAHRGLSRYKSMFHNFANMRKHLDENGSPFLFFDYELDFGANFPILYTPVCIDLDNLPYDNGDGDGDSDEDREDSSSIEYEDDYDDALIDGYGDDDGDGDGGGGDGGDGDGGGVVAGDDDGDEGDEGSDDDGAGDVAGDGDGEGHGDGDGDGDGGRGGIDGDGDVRQLQQSDEKRPRQDDDEDQNTSLVRLTKRHRSSGDV